jgi:hypothetical protein
MLHVLALASFGVVVVFAFDLWLWSSLFAAEQRPGGATTMRFVLAVGVALLALVFIGSIAMETMAVFLVN